MVLERDEPVPPLQGAGEGVCFSQNFTLGRTMKKPVWRLFPAVCALVIGHAWAGEVIGNTYIGERFGYIEMTSVEGKWDITDREKGATNDLAGTIAHFKLKEAVSGWKPDVNIMGFKKIEGAITADFVMNMMRKEWTAQGGEVEPIETGRIAGKKVFYNDKRIAAKGIPMMGRDIYLEGEKAIFIVHVIAPAHAFPQVLQLVEELVATAKY